MLDSPPTTATTGSSLVSSVASSSSSSVVSSTSDNTGTTIGIAAAFVPATTTTHTTPSHPANSIAAVPPTGTDTTRSSSRGSSKRKGVGTSGAVSASHVLRTTSKVPATSASGMSGGGGVDSHRNTSGAPPSPRSNPSSSSDMIAPPPRVALGAGNQSTSTAPEPTGLSGGSGGGSVSSSAGSSSGGGGSGGANGGGSSSGGGGGNNNSSLSSVSGGGSITSKDAQQHHFLYTAKHHNHQQRYQSHQSHHNHHHQNHHSISSVSAVTSSSVAAAAAASLNAAAASAQLVKEKDMRIAQLERELKIMESEFTRELDKLSKAESESTTFWQSKNSRLQQQVAQADTAIQLLRVEVELREAESAELRAGWEGMQRAAATREEETQSLRQQVRGLKEWVSTSTRADGQVTSDEVFGDGMARLANGLQNWVIVHFRRSKLDLSKAGKTARDDIARLVPTYEDLRHSSKLHLLQSAISRILVDLVFDSYFVGLPADQATQLADVESFLKTFAGAAEPINQWRALTLAIVRKDASQQLQTQTTRVTDDIVARVNGLLDAITDAPRSDVRDQALRQLVTSALELARLLVSQKAVFRVFMPSVEPHQQVFFDADTMEDIGGEEEDDDGLAQREITCVTFPGIIKRGDETGSHLQYTNVICKARVLCASG